MRNTTHRRTFLTQSTHGALAAATLLSTTRLVQAAAPTSGIQARPDLSRHFDAAGMPGTFALRDAASSKLTVVDTARAQRRYSPASTFKIPNSLIALETGVVKDIDEVWPWDHQPQSRKEWERDMDLREAIRVSNFPLYRRIARKIGPTRMKDWVAKLHYGNEQIGDVIDRFWVNDSLRISAVEQTQFLARLAQRQLPMSQRSQDMVHEITRIEKTSTYALHAKTGWYEGPAGSLGWWVGWVAQADGGIQTFALNVDMRGEADVPKRIPLGRTLLAEMGVLPGDAAVSGTSR